MNERDLIIEITKIIAGKLSRHMHLRATFENVDYSSSNMDLLSLVKKGAEAMEANWLDLERRPA